MVATLYNCSTWMMLIRSCSVATVVLECEYIYILNLTHYKEARNGSDGVGPVGFQIFGCNVKHCKYTMKDSLQRSHSKKYHDDR